MESTTAGSVAQLEEDKVKPARLNARTQLLFDILDVMEERHKSLSDDDIIHLLAHLTVTMCGSRNIERHAVVAVINLWGEREN